MRFRTYYDNSYVDEGLEFDINSSLTDQDFKMQTDVDYLLSHMAGHSRTPLYGVQDNMTFEDWSNEMALVKRRFLDLDPESRKRFGNAQEFLRWCADPNNYIDELPEVKNSRLFKKQSEDDIKKQEEKEDRLAKKIADSIKSIKE